MELDEFLIVQVFALDQDVLKKDVFIVRGVSFKPEKISSAPAIDVDIGNPCDRSSTSSEAPLRYHQHVCPGIVGGNRSSSTRALAANDENIRPKRRCGHFFHFFIHILQMSFWVVTLKHIFRLKSTPGKHHELVF
jgi:hypothetical protein